MGSISNELRLDSLQPNHLYFNTSVLVTDLVPAVKLRFLRVSRNWKEDLETELRFFFNWVFFCKGVDEDWRRESASSDVDALQETLSAAPSLTYTCAFLGGSN